MEGLGALLHKGGFIHSFCEPRDSSDFPGQLGRFTPCFVDVIILGALPVLGALGRTLFVCSGAAATARRCCITCGRGGHQHASTSPTLTHTHTHNTQNPWHRRGARGGAHLLQRMAALHTQRRA